MIATPRDLSDAYGATVATRTAHDLGIFEQLAGGPATPAEVAHRLGLDPTATAGLFLVLADLGLLGADPSGRFNTTERTGALLEALWHWDRLRERMIRPESCFAMDHAGSADEHYPKVVAMISAAMAPAAVDAADLLAGTGREVLDVGAGAGTWSIALARRDADCSFCLVDRPRVLEVARAHVEDEDLLARFAFRAADICKDDLGRQDFDLVMIGNVCHLFGEQDNAELLQRAFSALRRGGTLAIIDLVPEDYACAASATLHALSLIVRTGQGSVHAFSSYCAWLCDAGFQHIERACIGSDGAQASLIRARKP